MIPGGEGAIARRAGQCFIGASRVLCRQIGQGLEDGIGASQDSEDAVLNRDHLKRRLVRPLIAAGAGGSAVALGRRFRS
jgi:hypothetical protein